MKYPILIDSSERLEFHHKPGSFRPLRFDLSVDSSNELLGLFLAECWNRRPVDLMDTVIDHSKMTWDYWSLSYEDGFWRLRFHETSIEVQDDSLRRSLMELAIGCIADLYLEGENSETDVLEHRALRLCLAASPARTAALRARKRRSHCHFKD